MYCSVDDLRAAHLQIRLVETTDDAHPNTLGTFQVDIAQQVIELSCGIIDGFLDSVVTLPLAVTPVIVRKIAIDLTLHGLYERIGAVRKDDDMDMRKSGAMALLKEIQNKRVSLGLPKDQAAAAGVSTDAILISSGRAEFTERSMDSIGGGSFMRSCL